MEPKPDGYHKDEILKKLKAELVEKHAEYLTKIATAKVDIIDAMQKLDLPEGRYVIEVDDFGIRVVEQMGQRQQPKGITVDGVKFKNPKEAFDSLMIYSWAKPKNHLDRIRLLRDAGYNVVETW